MNYLTQAQNIFGTVARPDALSRFNAVEAGGLGQLINILINVLIAVAGIYAVFNIIFAGYTFMGASGDPKKVAEAWAKIYQTFLGLAVVAGTFVLAAIFGKLLYGNWGALLAPSIPTI